MSCNQFGTTVREPRGWGFPFAIAAGLALISPLLAIAALMVVCTAALISFLLREGVPSRGVLAHEAAVALGSSKLSAMNQSHAHPAVL